MPKTRELSSRRVSRWQRFCDMLVSIRTQVFFLSFLLFSEYIEQSKEQARADKEQAAKKHPSSAEKAKMRELAKKRKGGSPSCEMAARCRAADTAFFAAANVTLMLPLIDYRGEVSKMPWL
jgi:hypothetical protein